ncbi:MAG: Hsp70 family protein [Yoonia sp.]
MTKDFLSEILQKSKHKLEASGDNFPKKVLVAEPLSIEEAGEVSGQWLSNYRANIRTALDGWFDDIDFLPEPFAVFQYYRYGLNHPLLNDGNKHVALVLDFGGGTLDVSVIETTSTGDISHGGKNSRPLSAKSVAAAGFYINQRLAEDILFSALQNKEAKTKARKLIAKIGSFQSISDEEKSLLVEQELAFVENFTDLLSQVEKAKIRICNSISDWSLAANLHGTISHLVRVAEDPFAPVSRQIEVQLRAERLREVFESRVWVEKLRSAITNAIERAQKELAGQPISVVLLSGGSTNIRWLKRLLERDLKQYLNDAEVLEISENYQEVVAKGLAIECARQFYTEGDGDFGAVTYNRLNLALRPDRKDLSWCRFRAINEGLPQCDDEGTLLPSATSLRSFLNVPMKWKARLGSAPRSELEYHYLKSSFDPTDVDSVHNIVDHAVRTPKEATFGSSVEVELTVREDGTATPAFIYGRGKRETRVEGRPFYLDMTFADTEGARDAYLGLDFGTATSAVSLVSSEHISAYAQRSRDKAWLGLGDLVQELPYPIAHPLGVYITQTDTRQLEDYGRATLEAALTFIAFVSLSEIACLNKELRINRLFKDFRRSAGPLKHLIQEVQRLNTTHSPLATELLSIVNKEEFSLIDSAVTESAKAKHFKKSMIDYNHILSILGNHIKRALAGRNLGVFESTSKKGFGGGYQGLFRCLEGSNSPFVKLYDYEGPTDFSAAEVFVADVSGGQVIPLSPFYIWGLGSQLGNRDGYDLYCADMINPSTEKYVYFHAQQGGEVSLSEHEALKDIAAYVGALLSGNEELAPGSGMAFDLRHA